MHTEKLGNRLRLSSFDVYVRSLLIRASQVCCAVFAVKHLLAKEPQRMNQKAPELTQIDHWINSDGLKLADLKGKVVVLHFWTFGCINCQHNLPYYNKWQADFAKERRADHWRPHARNQRRGRPKNVASEVEKLKHQVSRGRGRQERHVEGVRKPLLAQHLSHRQARSNSLSLGRRTGVPRRRRGQIRACQDQRTIGGIRELKIRPDRTAKTDGARNWRREFKMSTPIRIVVLGGGFAGATTALQLERLFRRRSDVEITLLDSENFFTFTPLLPEVPSGSIQTNAYCVSIACPAAKDHRAAGSGFES